MCDLCNEVKVIDAEQAYADKRAKSLWGDAAWVLNQSDLNAKMFIVSSGKVFTPRHYGEGKSWDEAFINAGSSLFEPIPAYKFDAEDREILDRDCSCGTSTGIHGGLTRGTGKLDFNGYWEFPCTHGIEVTDFSAAIDAIEAGAVVYNEEQRERDHGRNWNEAVPESGVMDYPEPDPDRNDPAFYSDSLKMLKTHVDSAFTDQSGIVMYCINGEILDREKALDYLVDNDAVFSHIDGAVYLDTLPVQTGVKSIDCTLESLKEYCQYLMDHQCIPF